MAVCAISSYRYALLLVCRKCPAAFFDRLKGRGYALPFVFELLFRQRAPEGQPSQPQVHLPCFLLRMRRRMAKMRIRATSPPIKRSQMFIHITPSSRPNSRTSSAAAQASTHCQSTSSRAHLPPSSRRMAATAATQGV